jgi:hypothetical protein
MKTYAAVLLLLVVFTPANASAVSYTPTFYHRIENSEKVFGVGSTIYLFHSGTEEISRVVRDGDILAVYRITDDCQKTAVGRIRILRGIGDTCLVAEVVEGEIRQHDIAKMENVSLLVILVGICNH